MQYKVDVRIRSGTHQSEEAGTILYDTTNDRCVVVNKQLNDKERVAAALENPNLLDVVNQCLMESDRQQ